MTIEEFAKKKKDLLILRPVEFAEAYAKHYAEGSVSIGIYTEELRKNEALQKQVEELKELLEDASCDFWIGSESWKKWITKYEKLMKDRDEQA